MKLKLFIVILTLAIVPQTSKAFDWNSVSVGAGLSTMSILGDNANVWTILPKDTNKLYCGGSYSGAQIGFALKLYKSLDAPDTSLYEGLDSAEIERYKIKYPKFDNNRLILGLNYYYLDGRQAYAHLLVHYYLKHTQNVASLEFGIERNLFRIQKARSQIFYSVTANLNYVSESKLTDDIYLADGTTINAGETYNEDSTAKYRGYYESVKKSSTIRIGATAKIGIEGYIAKNITLNATWGVNIMNLFKDDSRGELLTHSKTLGISMTEYKESTVSAFVFSLLLKYKL